MIFYNFERKNMNNNQIPFKAICTKKGITLDTINGGTECKKIVDFAVESLGSFVKEVVDEDVSVGVGARKPQNDVYLNRK
jgi:hypothetical protein